MQGSWDRDEMRDFLKSYMHDIDASRYECDQMELC